MDYLSLLQAGSQEGQSCWSVPADSAPEGAADFIRALFAVVFSPPGSRRRSRLPGSRPWQSGARAT
eukprot:457053-Alexandrium_andersonii.AAC.1